MTRERRPASAAMNLPASSGVVMKASMAWAWNFSRTSLELSAPFSAPSAGPPPWYLYRLTLHTAFGVASAEPHGATRWRFAAGR